MKRLLRSALAQDVLGWLISLYVDLTMKTMRWRYVNREPADAALAGEPGGLALFWHGRIAMALICRDIFGSRPKRVIVSLSRDGEFVAKAAERLGVPTIRGSTGRAGRVMDKRGAAAFREAMEFIASGGAVIVTPDGPRGPNQVLSMGSVRLARASNCQVFFGGLAARPSIGFRSWDRARLPLPFSRGCMVLVGPLRVPEDADEAAMEATRADWQARMRAAQAQAEAILEARA